MRNRKPPILLVFVALFSALPSTGHASEVASSESGIEFYLALTPWTFLAIGAVLVVAVGWTFMRSVSAENKLSLEQRFQSLGTLEGKTQSDIESVAGPPSHQSPLIQGQRLCSWKARGFRLELIFQDAKCVGIGESARARG